MRRHQPPAASSAEYDQYDDGDYEEQGNAILVPAGSTRKTKVRDRTGRQVMRDTTVLKLRACIKCKLVMSEDQFLENGCPNCPELELDSNRDAIYAHTTPHFKGFAVILRPDASWVARYNNLTQLAPGSYAISISSGGY